jgi:hypothetical protein
MGSTWLSGLLPLRRTNRGANIVEGTKDWAATAQLPFGSGKVVVIEDGGRKKVTMFVHGFIIEMSSDTMGF